MSSLSNYEKMTTAISLDKDGIAVVQEKVEGDLFVMLYSSLRAGVRIFSKGVELDKETSNLYHNIEKSIDLEYVISDVMYKGICTSEGKIYLLDLYDNGTSTALDFNMVNQECERLGFYLATVVHHGAIESKDHLTSLIKDVEEIMITNFDNENILNRQITYKGDD